MGTLLLAGSHGRAQTIDGILAIVNDDVITESEFQDRYRNILRDLATRNAGLDKIPLWYYCLQEAEETARGKLGQVGGRIVATVLMRLLKNDPNSIWHHPDFTPCFGNNGEDFGMGHVADFVDDEWGSVKFRDDLTCSYDDDRV